MKTIEQRAKDYAELHLLNGYYDKGTENAYVKGATEQREIDVKAAVDAYRASCIMECKQCEAICIYIRNFVSQLDYSYEKGNKD